MCWRASTGGEGSLGKVLENPIPLVTGGSSTSFLLPGASPWELVAVHCHCHSHISAGAAFQHHFPENPRIPESPLPPLSPGRGFQEKPRSCCVLLVGALQAQTQLGDTGEAGPHPGTSGDILWFAFSVVFPHMTRIDIPQAIFKAILF